MIIYTGVIFLFNFKKSLNLKKVAFSLIELMISLIVISLVAAAFTPVITKKLKTSSIFGSSGGGNSVSANCQGKFDSDCKLCTKDLCVMCKKTCESGYMLEADSCKCNQIITINNCKVYSTYSTCNACEDGYYLSNNECKAYSVLNCATFSSTEDKCLSCPFGFYLKNDSCTQYTAQNCATYSSLGDQCATCPSGYTLSSGACVKNLDCSGRYFYKKSNLCITKYNMNDSDENLISSSAEVTMYLMSSSTSGTKCSASNGRCCWQGVTSGGCGSTGDYFENYSGCHRTICTWKAANAICATYKNGGKVWRLPTKDEMQNWIAISKELQLCPDADTGCRYSSCLPGFFADLCYPSAIHASQEGVQLWWSNATRWFASSLNANAGYSVRCVTDI